MCFWLRFSNSEVCVFQLRPFLGPLYLYIYLFVYFFQKCTVSLRSSLIIWLRGRSGPDCWEQTAFTCILTLYSFCKSYQLKFWLSLLLDLTNLQQLRVDIADISELNLAKTISIHFPNGKDNLLNFEITIRPDEGYYQWVLEPLPSSLHALFWFYEALDTNFSDVMVLPKESSRFPRSGWCYEEFFMEILLFEARSLCLTHPVGYIWRYHGLIECHCNVFAEVARLSLASRSHRCILTRHRRWNARPR